jgi:hypothetical protein
MAIVPISQPLAPGLLAADYSPWSPQAEARSGLFGIPGVFDYAHPARTTGGASRRTGITGYIPDITPTWSPPGGPMVSDIDPVDGVGSGLPMPEVEGYKYVYPKYAPDYEGGWERSGYSEDRDAYDYYPYFPTGLSPSGSNILVGVELLKE